MLAMFSRRYMAGAVVVSGLLAGSASAQPADRAAAIVQAAGAAQSASPGTWFVAAELQPEGATWVVDVRLASTDGTRLTRSRVNAFTMALGRVRVDTLSGSSATALAALVASEATATRTLSEALSLAGTQAGAGAVLTGVELDLENSPPGLFYDVTTSTGGVSSVTRVSAIADAGGGGSGGVGSPDDHGGGGGGGADDPAGGGGAVNLGPLPALADAILAVSLANPGSFVLEAESRARADGPIYSLELVAPDGLVLEVKVGTDGTVLEARPKVVDAQDAAKIDFVRGAIGGAVVGLGDALRLVSTADPAAQVLSAEWEGEHGRLVIRVLTRVGASSITWTVDAATGGLVSGGQPGAGGATVVGMSTVMAAATGAAPGMAPLKVEQESEDAGVMFGVLLVNPADLTARRVIINGQTGAVVGVTGLTLSRKQANALKPELAHLGELQVAFEGAAGAVMAQAAAAGGFIKSMEVDVNKKRIGYSVDVLVGKTRLKFFVDGVSGVVSKRR